jgi:hypothetical protein
MKENKIKRNFTLNFFVALKFRIEHEIILLFIQLVLLTQLIEDFRINLRLEIKFHVSYIEISCLAGLKSNLSFL